MGRTSSWAVPFACAVVAPSTVVWVVCYARGLLSDGVITASIVIPILAALHVGVVGLPGVALLHRLGLLNKWTLLIVGFVAGCLPFTILGGIVEFSDAKVNFNDFGYGVLFLGACGVFGAIAYAAAVVIMRRPGDRLERP
jgi:hypothetical protein